MGDQVPCRRLLHACLKNQSFPPGEENITDREAFAGGGKSAIQAARRTLAGREVLAHSSLGCHSHIVQKMQGKHGRQNHFYNANVVHAIIAF